VAKVCGCLRKGNSWKETQENGRLIVQENSMPTQSLANGGEGRRPIWAHCSSRCSPPKRQLPPTKFMRRSNWQVPT
jgi:hypothetical protein